MVLDASFLTVISKKYNNLISSKLINSVNCYKKNLDLLSSVNTNNKDISLIISKLFKRRLKIFQNITEKEDLLESSNPLEEAKFELKLFNHEFDKSDYNLTCFNSVDDLITNIYSFRVIKL